MRNELTALRRRMAAAGVDAYLIPTDDFHGSEYVGDHFKCRAYVSGFTGSAGTLNVLQDQAGLWTDGRYFPPGRGPAGGQRHRPYKMGMPGVPDEAAFLKDALRSGQVLGFDGRTVTARRFHTLEKALAGRGVRFQTELDLAGDIWEDRPSLSAAPVWALEETYSGRARAEKLAAVRARMAAEHTDLLLLSSLDDIAWLLNFRGGDVACCPVALSYLALSAEEAHLFINERIVDDALRADLASDGVDLRPTTAYTPLPPPSTKSASGWTRTRPTAPSISPPRRTARSTPPKTPPRCSKPSKMRRRCATNASPTCTTASP